MQNLQNSESKSNGRGHRLAAASVRNEKRATQHREALRKFPKIDDLNMSDLAEKIGKNNGILFINLLRGISSAFDVSSLLDMCEAFPGTTIDRLAGRSIVVVDSAVGHVTPAADLLFSIL